MYLFNILCILFTFNVNSCEGNHTQIDDELPAISWKECVISLRNCDEKSTSKDPLVSSRVWGGEYANTGEYPWFVYYRTILTDISEMDCNAAIVNEWWIITAAHCLLSLSIKGSNSIIVYLGALNRLTGRPMDIERVVLSTVWWEDTIKDIKNSDRQEWLISEINRREKLEENQTLISELLEEYLNIDIESLKNWKNISAIQWDIALMKVKHRIVPHFNETHYKINSICLPKSGITNSKNERAVIMGMGATEMNVMLTFKLKKGITKILDTNTCANRSVTFVNIYNRNDMICAERQNTQNDSLFNSSVCAGDSCSPLHQYYKCKAVQMSVLSNMEDPGEGGVCSYYSWFTRISKFMPSIRSVILSNDIIVISKTNNLLIVSVITTAIIAFILCFTLLCLNHSFDI